MEFYKFSRLYSIIRNVFILANILIGSDASGELSIVQTLSGFMCGIIVLIYSVFLPRMTEKYANESYEHLAKEVRFSQKY